MYELASVILERIVEGLAIADIGEEGSANCDVDHSTRHPFIYGCEEESKSETVDDSSDHVLGLQAVLLELVDVLSELLLVCHYLSH